MKDFIITIDTEGDNLWEHGKDGRVTTENTAYLPRFQRLCDTFGFKPVWLTNYEMISDPTFVDFVSTVVEEGRGELGMHLHAWNSPPQYELTRTKPGDSYLIEYPYEIMEEKTVYMTELIQKRTGYKPRTHRAGRWMLDERYARLLKKYDYTVDCSITPHEDWSVQSGMTMNGLDYGSFPEQPYYLDDEKTLLEVPVSIRYTHRFFAPQKRSVRPALAAIKHSVEGQKIWIRPGQSREDQIHWMLDLLADDPNTQYAMFMLHSSEFMPGGSPRFRTKESIEELYCCIERIFRHAAKHFSGTTLQEYRSRQ